MPAVIGIAVALFVAIAMIVNACGGLDVDCQKVSDTQSVCHDGSGNVVVHND